MPHIGRVELGTRESNPAVALYQRLGFVIDARFERRIRTPHHIGYGYEYGERDMARSLPRSPPTRSEVENAQAYRYETDLAMAWFNPDFVWGHIPPPVPRVVAHSKL